MKTVIVLLILFVPACCLSFEINPCQNSDNPRLNLIFVACNYQNKKEFIMDIGILLAKLKKVQPFDECISSISVSWVDILTDEEKIIFKPTEGLPPLTVNTDFLNKLGDYYKSNYKLVIIDKTGSITCAELSALLETSLIILGKARYGNANSFAKGFLHELGHSLGLRDECVNCPQVCLPGPPNCARNKEEAKSLWQDLVSEKNNVDYIRGCCGNLNYYRPTIASLMNDTEKAENFGAVNERYLREILTVKKQNSLEPAVKP